MQQSTALGKARAYLQNGQHIPEGILAPSISDSWARCRAQGLIQTLGLTTPSFRSRRYSTGGKSFAHVVAWP